MKGLFLFAALFQALRAASSSVDVDIDLSASLNMAPLPSTKVANGSVVTQDGVHLRYTQAGPADGQNLLFIPGWRQTAAQWRKQVAYFSDAGYRVTAYDMRGHGDSEKAEHGYRLSRFGADLHDVLRVLDLHNVSVVAHSMGSSVAWAFWDQYPSERRRLDHLAVVDQSAVLVADPTWTAAQAETWSAALFTPAQTYEFARNMSAETPPFVQSMFTPDVPRADYEWALAQNLKMSHEHAAALLVNHAFADWRDVLPRIDIPTLVLSGDVSVNNASGIAWAATQIPGARSYTFTAEERGSHFMFWENPERFNQVIEEFVTS